MPPDQSTLAADVALRLAGASDADADVVILDALAALARPVGADRAYVTVYRADATLAIPYEWTAPGVVPHGPAIDRTPIERFGYSFRVAQAGKVLHVRRLEELPVEAGEERRSFGAFGVRTVVQIPIRVDGELLGVVGFNHGQPFAGWSTERLAELEQVGKAIGVALSRNAARERMSQAVAVAEQAGRAKDELLSRASHELRTPLHAVLGYAEILELDGVTHDALVHIRENGTLLLSMIDDLLDLGRIRASIEGRNDAHRPAEEIVAEVIHDLGVVAAARGVSLELQGGEVTVSTAAGLLRQVAHCVASAALVAAGPGGAVTASLHNDAPHIDGAQPAGAGPLRLEVRYRGPRHRPAAGLGLALARSFADDAGAALSVHHHVDGAGIEVRFQR